MVAGGAAIVEGGSGRKTCGGAVATATSGPRGREACQTLPPSDRARVAARPIQAGCHALTVEALAARASAGRAARSFSARTRAIRRDQLVLDDAEGLEGLDVRDQHLFELGPEPFLEVAEGVAPERLLELGRQLHSSLTSSPGLCLLHA
jgi:hypothetical protein